MNHHSNTPRVSGAAQAPQRQDVQNTLSTVIARLEYTESRVSAMEDRLAPVLTPSPAGALKDDPPQPARSPLADCLATQVRRVEAINARIDTLLDRLEV